MIKAICAFVTATGSELSLSFSIFIMGSNLHPYSQKSIGHLSKEADVNDYSTERQESALWHCKKNTNCYTKKSPLPKEVESLLVNEE